MTDMEVYVKESLALDGGDIEETRTQAEIEAAPLRDKVERLTKALRGLLATVPEDWPERENEGMVEVFLDGEAIEEANEALESTK